MTELQVPIGKNGKPLAKVTNSYSERVNLALINPKMTYSHADLGPAFVTRYVEDEPEAILEGLRECARDASRIVDEERNALIEDLNPNKE